MIIKLCPFDYLLAVQEIFTFKYYLIVTYLLLLYMVSSKRAAALNTQGLHLHRKLIDLFHDFIYVYSPDTGETTAGDKIWP